MTTDKLPVPAKAFLSFKVDKLLYTRIHVTGLHLSEWAKKRGHFPYYRFRFWRWIGAI